MCDLTALWFVLIKNKNPFSPSLFSRLLGIITKKDILKHMEQMANRDPDSILFNWRLSRLNGHSCTHTHTQRAESSCEDDDDDGGDRTVCVAGVLLLYSGLRVAYGIFSLFHHWTCSDRSCLVSQYTETLLKMLSSHTWEPHIRPDLNRCHQDLLYVDQMLFLPTRIHLNMGIKYLFLYFFIYDALLYRKSSFN